MSLQDTTNEIALLLMERLTRRFINRDIEEVVINRPGEIVFKSRQGSWDFEPAPELDQDYLWKVCKVLANINDKQFDAATVPIVSAELPVLPYRFQGILGSNVRYGENDRSGVAIAIRHLKAPDNIGFARYGLGEGAAPEDIRTPGESSFEMTEGVLETLYEVVAARESVLISGSTSTGKTTFLNQVVRLIPESCRIITVEDAREVHVPQKNRVHLLVPRTKGANDIGYREIIDALMRMTPDWIIPGELSVDSALPTYGLMGKGHPIASTVHAGTPREALEAFANNISLAGSSMSKKDILDSLARQVGAIIQLERVKDAQGQDIRRVREAVFPSRSPDFQASLSA